MFTDFLNRLKPLNFLENYEWQEVISDFKNEFGPNEPTLFWYLSSGIDLTALVYFNEKVTRKVYKTPTVDFFIYSDYGGIIKQLNKYYNDLDNGPVTLYEDYSKIYPILEILLPQSTRDFKGMSCRTRITLEQMIPLRYFSDHECEIINEKYKDNRFSSFAEEIIHNRVHFYYCMIIIENNYFGEEYFPTIFSPIENWVLMEEVWKKQGILFDYVCGVCDGCRRGGAYKCVNKHYKDFLPIMREKRRYWVSDHIHQLVQSVPEFKTSFCRIAELREWGHYNLDEQSASYLYEVL